MRIVVQKTELAPAIARVGWDAIRALRQLVSSELAQLDAPLREATALAAAELAENAIKYGLDGAPSPSIEVELRDGLVEVVAENTPASAADAETVRRILAKIARQADPEKLYVDAMARSAARSRPDSTRQGFQRIVAVAGFRLEAEEREQRLVIRARRAIGGSV
jgi:hypothetical protein